MGIVRGKSSPCHSMTWKQPKSQASVPNFIVLNTSTTPDKLELMFSGADIPSPSSTPQAQIIPPKPPIPPKTRNILLPNNVPVFYLHGTFATGDSLTPMVQFIENLQNHHPGYISYLPEVQTGTGIETVDNPKTQVPAYKLAIRDMGDFHYQVVLQNLKKLGALILKPSPENQHATALQTALPSDRFLPFETVKNQLEKFFDLIPEESPTLLPVIWEFLAKRVFELPPEFKSGDSLAVIVEKNVNKVRKEAQKLDLAEAAVEDLQDRIIDTHFLKSQASLQGKTVNYTLNEVSDDPKVINLRSPIQFKDIAVLEAYLMFIEKKLRLTLEKSFKAQYSEDIAGGLVSEEAVKQRAQKTAAKLMEKIAPQGMALGHSQGGTVLMSALLNYLAKAPKSPEKAMLEDAPGSEELGGRYIGIEALFNAPLKGIPEEPMWGIQLNKSIEQWFLGAKANNRFTKWAFRKVLWRFFEHNRPAVREMKVGSPLMTKFKEIIHLLRGQGVTVVSAHDLKDSFVEPAATLLFDERNHLHQETFPKNIFNIPLQAPDMPQQFEDGTSLIEAEIRNQGFSPNSIPAKLLRWLPNFLIQGIYQSYLGVISGLGQHGALVNFPDYTRKELGKKLITDPEMQTRVLDTSNFEPFRYQTLVARGKIYQQNVLNLPTPEAIKALSIFESQYPTFLNALVNNAKEWAPMTNSAAYAATEIMDKTLDLMEKGLLDPALKKKYGYSIQRGLRQMAEGNLPPLSKGRVSPSLRAEALLKLLENRPV
ncbi:MAG: hypothetical protein K2X66_14110 [Cyanobacteria bacterium]|nr:hypothetical protein [Cyanobacteriota bacterium]